MNSKLVFLARFILIFGIVNIAIYFLDWNFLNNWIAQIVGTVLGLTVMNENGFWIHEREVIIANYCNGLTSIGILAGLILGFRKPGWEKKIKIILVGSVILFLINLLRVFAVVYSGIVFGISVLETVHFFSWIVLAGIILGYWYWAVKKIGKINKLSELIE